MHFDKVTIIRVRMVADLIPVTNLCLLIGPRDPGDLATIYPVTLRHTTMEWISGFPASPTWAISARSKFPQPSQSITSQTGAMS